MAEIVLALGASHSPLLTIDWTEWQNRAAADLANPALNLSDGRTVSYEQLKAERGEPYAGDCTPEAFARAAQLCEQWLNRLGDALEQAAPDIVLVIGDDQGELFALSNTPMISVFYGDEIVTSDVFGGSDKPAWVQAMAKGYAMDDVHQFPGAPALALDLINGLVRRHVDVGASSCVDDPKVAGFGHAFGFIAQRLFRDRPIPMLPVLLNTYFPPNVMGAERAWQVGRLIGEAIGESPSDARVAVIASGGLSHFVVDEDLDRAVIAGLAPGNDALLRAIPPEALMSGSSEILNWIMTAGVASQLTLEWAEYEPIRRTPAGTGIGLAFAKWA
jgi:hypothetical protein